MARYVTRVKTPWPAEKAFDYMADLRNFADWDPGVTASTLASGEAGRPGSAYDVAVRSVGRDLTLTYVLDEFRGGERFAALAKSSALTSLDIVTVEPDGEGSIVTYDAELTLNGLLSPADFFLRMVFDRIGDRAAAGLRIALDGEDAGT